MTWSRTKNHQILYFLTSFGFVENLLMCSKKIYIILLIKILTNWKSIHYLFLLNEKHSSYVWQNTFKYFAAVISFNLTTKILYGDSYYHFTKKKKYWESERFKCHVQVKIIGHWEDLNFPSPVSVTSVSTDWSPLCAQWMQDRPHLTPLESEGKEHTCCSVLGSVLNWEYVQKLRAKQGGLWKVCHRWNGQQIYEC